MSTKFRDVIQGAQYRSDQSVNGVGPHNGERTTDGEWRFLLNRSINSMWRLASSARPDFQVTSVDFSLISGGSASFPLPSNFFGEIDVCWSPDQPNEYSLGSFSWANRRAPGGWFPANFGGTTNYGGNSIRIMGDTLFVEPSFRAAGNYRLWFCPKAKNIRADLTVRLASTAAIPPHTSSGIGLGHTLFGTTVAILTLDGSPTIAGDLILIKNEVDNNNGVYVVNQPGDGVSVPFLVTRASTAVT